ncbi:MAG: hypothetical protein KDA60_13140 [Planctomycetales bacterium]|nr:hypothetical protein [Planctomycetales bacterium]
MKRLFQFFRGPNKQVDDSMEFGVESLESRRLLTGNVVVRDLAGALIIRGDQLDNAFVVAEVVGNRYTVTPSLGTTINGSASTFTTRVYENEPRFVINTGAGNDGIGLQNLSDLRSLSVVTGDGRDVIGGNAIETRGRMSFNMGRGDDVLSLTAAESKGSFSVNVGDGDDMLALIGVDGTVGRIVTGNGDDLLAMSDADFNRSSLMMGSGDDGATIDTIQSQTESVASINLGSGNDQIRVSSFEAQTLLVNAGTGDDSVSVTSPTQIAGRSVFAGGAGIDDLDLSGTSFGIAPRVVMFESVVGI